MSNIIRTITAIALFAFASVAAHAIETGSTAPEFTLTDSNGTSHKLSDFKGKHVVLEWTNHGCPFVVKHYAPGNMQKLQKEWTGKGVIWLTINSTNADHQDYQSPAQANAWLKETKAAPTAFLIDADGKVGHLYDAKTTPHLFIIDPAGKLIYQGAIDSIRSPKSEDIAKAENYVEAALKAATAGKPVATPTTKSYGCGVKYK
ncbi:MAG: thioredoxin family protein [Verrucomicrobiota bacterium]|nr:thioredoxin family protein [Verrucomicrobiota bacterium]